MADWLQLKISSLTTAKNDEEISEIWAEIKIKLASLNENEIKEITRSLDFNCLFSLLTADESDCNEHVCEVLKMLLNASDPGAFVQKYRAEVLRLMAYQTPSVQSLMLDEILRCVCNSETLPIILSNSQFLITVIDRIGDNDLAVAKISMAIAKKIGEHSKALHVIYSKELLKTFNNLLSKNHTVSFRVYEVVVHIAKTSQDGLDASIKSGLMNKLLGVLDNDDVLLELIALETITELAVTENGFRYLEQQNVLRDLDQKVEHALAGHVAFGILIPGLMKFFGNVARLWPHEFFAKYPTVVTALFEVLGNGDVTILGVALDTLGHVGSTVQGKYSLQALGGRMATAMKMIGDVIQESPTALRIRALNNVALLLDVKKAEQDNKILSLTKEWFDFISADSMRTLVGLCRQPFADIRQASLEVLAVVASQTWGQEYISAHPGVVEFLLDRNVESFKECKEAKFEIVRQLSQGEQNIFDANTIQRFKNFIDQGPFYVDTYTEVAMESAS